MLAAIGDYFFWWQLPLLAVLFLIWLLGGWPLLWVGGRFIARARRATLGMALLARLVSGAVGFVVMAALPVGLGSLLGGGGAVAGLLLALPAALLLGWLMIKLVLATSYGRAILAWLPTLAVWIVALPLLIALVMPSLTRSRGMAARALCASNLRQVGVALTAYWGETGGQMPADLNLLVQSNRLAAEATSCPYMHAGVRGRYFYQPLGLNRLPTQVLACDCRGNHAGGRNVLFADGAVRWMDEGEFQAELAKPQNADFAEALRAAEGPAVPASRPGGP